MGWGAGLFLLSENSSKISNKIIDKFFFKYYNRKAVKENF